MAQFLLAPLPWSRESNDYEKEREKKTNQKDSKRANNGKHPPRYTRRVAAMGRLPPKLPKIRKKMCPEATSKPTNSWDPRRWFSFLWPATLSPGSSPGCWIFVPQTSRSVMLPNVTEDERLEPTNHPFGKEHDRNQPSMIMFYVNLQGCINSSTKNGHKKTWWHNSSWTKSLSNNLPIIHCNPLNPLASLKALQSSSLEEGWSVRDMQNLWICESMC